MEAQVATKSDIPAIMLMERVEGYARLVGRWDAEQHATEIENPSSGCLLAREGADAAGFAILQGVGSSFLRSVLQICFDDLAAHRVELFVFEDNERACRTYLKTGFVEEGIVRDLHREADGNFRSIRLMSLLRPEWLARRNPLAS